MIQLSRITITRAEGPIHLCDKPCVAESWGVANRLLFWWSNTAPKTGGYDKCDFTITFADGETYSGRYDLQHWQVGGYPDLGAHVRDFLRYLAGEPPAWMHEAHDSGDVLSRYYAEIAANPERTAEAKRWLETYDLNQPEECVS